MGMRTKHRCEGSTLIIVLLIGSVVLAVAVALLGKVTGALRLAGIHKISMHAGYIAEAGIERTRARLSDEADWTDTVALPDALYTNEPLAGGSYTVTLSERDVDEITVTSTGTVGGVGRTIETRLRVSAPWWDDNYKCRRTVDIDNASTEILTDYQVRMQVDFIPGAMDPDFNDLRFTDSVSNPLSFWVESYVTGVSAIVWVKVPSMPASDTVTIYMYYNNSAAASASDRDATMDFMELGSHNLRRQNSRGQWRDTIAFDAAANFTSPVVIAQPDVTYNETNELVLRMRNVTAASFRLKQQEPRPPRNDRHGAETICWAAIDAGTWQTLDGVKIEADKYSTGANIHAEAYSVNTSDAISFKYTLNSPVVLSQAMTYDDNHFVKTRQYNLSSTGFRVGMEEEGDSTSGHGTETLGWIAVESGSGTWEAVPYEVGKTADAVTDSWYPINFTQGYTAAPVFLVWMQTRDGPDSSGMRADLLTNSSVAVKVEEDTTYDGETGHITEIVGYVAVEQPGIYPIAKYVFPEPVVTIGEEEGRKGTTVIYRREIAE